MIGISGGRRGRLNHGVLASPAAIARADDALHPILHRHDVQHLARGLANDVERSAAASAGLGLRIDAYLDARQMFRQLAAIALGGFARLFASCSAGLTAFAGFLRCGRRRGQIEDELQLIGIELFRALPKQGALECSQDVKEL